MLISTSKVYIHDPLYKRITVEVKFDEETIKKIKALNKDEGFTITDVHMKIYDPSKGVVIQLEKELSEEEDE